MSVKSLVFTLAMVIFTQTCGAQTLNSKVANYMATKVGVRCGGGECAHAATEALRVAGAEFSFLDLGPDSPGAGDYVWGTLVKEISAVTGRPIDSKPTTTVLPGDIIQYRNVKFVTRNSSSSAVKHTSVVAGVTTAGTRPSFVYEQNVNGVRTLRKNPVDFKTMTAGYVRIYRPKARVNRKGQTKLTVTNNYASSQSVALTVGSSSLGSTTLTQSNTANSYAIFWATTGTLPLKLKLSNGASVSTATGKAYEIYRKSTGAAGIRQLSP